MLYNGGVSGHNAPRHVKQIEKLWNEGKVRDVKCSQKGKKRRSIGYVFGGIAVAAGMCVVMPKLIEKGSDCLYSKNQHSVKPQEEDDWGPEIVKKDTVEDTEDGEI